MCWPPGKAERRYAGVTHLDVTTFDSTSAEVTREMLNKYNVTISSLGYYSNPLCSDPAEREIRETGYLWVNLAVLHVDLWAAEALERVT